MNGVGVVGSSVGIGIGNGDALILEDGPCEGELNVGAGGGNSGNGVVEPAVVTAKSVVAAVVEERASS